MGNLTGKSIYAFGDSLVKGHLLKVGILDDVAEKQGMKLSNFAVNGATVIPGTARLYPGIADVGDIAEQIEAAPEKQPDFICFNGMTNDSFEVIVKNHLGQISDSYDGGYDLTTFSGAFENICYQLRCKYRDSVILYITPHKMPVRSVMAQQCLHDQAKEICHKWSIPVVDIYEEGQINTRIDSMRDEYSYYSEGSTKGGDGMHLNPEGYRRWYTPVITSFLNKFKL